MQQLQRLPPTASDNGRTIETLRAVDKAKKIPLADARISSYVCIWRHTHTHTHTHKKHIAEETNHRFSNQIHYRPETNAKDYPPVGYNPPDRILMPSWNHLALPNARKIETDLRKSNLRSCAWHYLDCRTINPPLAVSVSNAGSYYLTT